LDVIALRALDGVDSIRTATVVVVDVRLNVRRGVFQRGTAVGADVFLHHRLMWFRVNDFDSHVSPRMELPQFPKRSYHPYRGCLLGPVVER